MEKITIDEATKLLQFVSKGFHVPPIILDTLMKVCKYEIEDKEKVVLVKRDPDVGKGRLQAMLVKIVYGNTVEIYPPAVGSFNMDFDGDCVGIFTPLSEEAQKQAKEKMITATSNERMNAPNFELSKEILAGVFFITYIELDNNVKEMQDIEEVKKLHPGISINIKFRGNKIKTTAGRLIFNNALPNYYPYYEGPVPKKILFKILSGIMERSKPDFLTTLDNLMRLGIYYSTVYPKTVSLDMLKSNEELEMLKKQLFETKNTEEQHKILDTMTKVLKEYIKKDVPDLYIWAESGAAKDIAQLRQMVVSKGIVKDASGDPLPPIIQSITDGYSPEQYFDAAAGAREGLIQKAIGTASGGYEYRKVIFAIGNVTADINKPDCETRKTLDIKLTNDLFDRMSGRYVIENSRILPINNKMIGKVIHLRSPIFCKSKSICRLCYGELLKQIKSKNVGIIAAQEVASLAERFLKCSVGLIERNNNMYSLEDIFEGDYNDSL